MRRSWTSAGAGAVLVAFTLLGGTDARADDDEVLVRRGLELRRDGNDMEALTLFQRAYRTHPTARTRAQIALAEQSLAEWSAAEADLENALRSDDAWIARNREPLEEALKFVATHLGWLTVSSNVPSARIVLDGAVVGMVPLAKPARVSAGSVRVRVEADGYVPKESTVRVAPNVFATEYLVLSPVPSPEPAPAARARTVSAPPVSLAAPPRSRGFPWAALGAATVGLAGVGVGAAFGVDVLIQKAARDENCTASGCNSTGLERDADARRFAMVSDIAFGVGAAGVAASVWLLLRGAERPRSVDVTATGTASSATVSAVGAW
jgi:hypothetical protein